MPLESITKLTAVTCCKIDSIACFGSTCCGNFFRARHVREARKSFMPEQDKEDESHQDAQISRPRSCAISLSVAFGLPFTFTT